MKTFAFAFLFLISSYSFAENSGTLETGIKSIYPSYVRDEWTIEDTERQSVTISLIGINFLQNIETLQGNNFYNDLTTYNFFTKSLFSGFANTTIAYYLPANIRKNFQYFSIGWEGNEVSNKLNLRIDIKF